MKVIKSQVNEPIAMRWQFNPTTYVVGNKRGYHPDPSFFMKKKQIIERNSEHFDLKLNHNVGKTDGS